MVILHGRVEKTGVFFSFYALAGIRRSGYDKEYTALVTGYKTHFGVQQSKMRYQGEFKPKWGKSANLVENSVEVVNTLRNIAANTQHLTNLRHESAVCTWRFFAPK
jgi:hypothetical protein